MAVQIVVVWKWRSVPLGPLVLGDSDGYVTYTTRRAYPFTAFWGKMELSRHHDVAGAQKSVEQQAKLRGL